MLRTDRIGGSFGVIMVDVDHFKTINDTYGHLVGDGVLREVASRLRTTLRTYDSIGRFGGEEFLVIAPGCAATGAKHGKLAERLRHAVGGAPIVYSGRTLAVISLGVAAGAGSPARDALLRGADEALYTAKSNGLKPRDDRGVTRSDDRPWSIPCHQVDDQQHDPDQKQDPRDLRGDGGDTVNTKRPGNQAHDEEHQGVIQHDVFLLPVVSARGLPSQPELFKLSGVCYG